MDLRKVEKGGSRMKGWKKGLAGTAIGLVVVMIGIGMWQRENVQALWEGVSYTDEQLKSQMETSKEKVKQSLEQYQIKDIRDLTVAEEEQLMKGEMTVEEALDLITKGESRPTIEEKEALANKYELDEPIASISPQEESQSHETVKVGVEQIVETYVKKMYTLQVTFLSELGAIESRARDVFSQLPKEERNLSTAQKLAPSFINEALALEEQCDSQVNTLLNAFQKELKSIGADTSIVKDTREAYETQKRLKKAYYLAAIK